MAIHEAGHDLWSGAVHVDAEVENIRDSEEGSAIHEEIIPLDDDEVRGQMDAEFVGDDIVGETRIARPIHLVGPPHQQLEMLSKAADVHGVGLSLHQRERNL